MESVRPKLSSQTMASYRDHLVELINAGDQRQTASSARPNAADEPVTILNGAIGLIADSIQVQNELTSFEPESGEGKMAVDALKCALKSFKPTIQVAYKTLRQVEQDSLPSSDRCALLNTEIITATLTHAILAMSEVATLLMEVTSPSRETNKAAAVGVDQAKALKRHTYQICKADCILSKIPSVLMVSDEGEALRQKSQIAEKAVALIQSNPLLLDRLLQIRNSTSEDSDASSHTLADDKPPEYSPSLDRNRDSGVSIDSEEANSIFSGATLTDVSTLSTATLPITPSEVKHCTFYTADYCDSARGELDVALELNAKNKSREIARALGLEDAGPSLMTINQRRRLETSDTHRAPAVMGVRVGAYADQIWHNVCEPTRESRSRQSQSLRQHGQH